MADDELVRLARKALGEITPESTVGDVLDQTVAEDGVITLTFATTMLGYPGWRWTVSIAHLPGEEPTVLETELLPGDGALLAPDWVPWSERLEEYRAAQAAAAAEAEAEGDEASDDDESDDDESDDDEDEVDATDVYDEDDDFGDDPDDGIDFESAVDEGEDDDESDADDETGADDEGLDASAAATPASEVDVDEGDEPEA